MPILQVRQVPEELYEELSRTAEASNRSISQETVTLLKEALGWKGDRRIRRKAVLAEISGMPKLKTGKFPDPVKLIREDRER
jgi:hypothetical protein